MTESEALKRMKMLIGISPSESILESFKLVSEALEEVEQYRAIGTVRGYERAIETSKENYNLYREYKTLLREYEAIGTIEEFKALKQWKSDIIESFSKYDVNSVDEMMKRFRELTEKAEPKKPFRISETDDNDNALVECPVCHANDEYSVKTIKSGHCWKCGQRLDWE